MTMLAGAPTINESSKVAAAAEDLVKTAYSHMESTSLTNGKDTLESLKKLASDSSSIEKSVGLLKEVHEAKMDALGQSISDMKQAINKSISDLKQEMVNSIDNVSAQSKHNMLAFAISNAGFNSFEYYVGTSYKQVESTEFVKHVLMAFRAGSGCDISGRRSTQNNYHERNGDSQFREALSKQIHELTGQKPRIEKENDRYVIYYS